MYSDTERKRSLFDKEQKKDNIQKMAINWLTTEKDVW